MARKRSGRTKGEDGLTHRQRLFVEEYCKDRNARRAALTAGYSLSVADHPTENLLSNPCVAKAIEERTQEIIKNTALTPETILNRIWVLAVSGRQESTRLNALKTLAEALGMFTQKVQFSSDIKDDEDLVQRIVEQLSEYFKDNSVIHKQIAVLAQSILSLKKNQF